MIRFHSFYLKLSRNPEIIGQFKEIICPPFRLFRCSTSNFDRFLHQLSINSKIQFINFEIHGHFAAIQIQWIRIDMLGSRPFHLSLYCRPSLMHLLLPHFLSFFHFLASSSSSVATTTASSIEASSRRSGVLG
jgi:hypothetical protein